MVNYRPDVFSAIADPTRRAMLDALRAGELGAGEIADRFPISRPAVSRHLKILRKARVDAQRRYYSLTPEALADVDRWLAPYRLFWSARLMDIKHYVEGQSEEGEKE